MGSDPPQPPGGEPCRLGDLLAAVFARIGPGRSLDDYRIWQAWDEVVGAVVARNAQPIRLDGRRLVVAVRSTTWMQELSLLRRDLCGRLNAWMRREVITEILLVIGKVDPPPSAVSNQTGASGPGRRSRLGASRAGPATDRDRQRSESADQTRMRLEAAIEKLWEAARKRQRSGRD